TDFAMSRPIVVIVCMTWLLRIVGALGTHVPVEEPSTASQADILRCGRSVRNFSADNGYPLLPQVNSVRHAFEFRDRVQVVGAGLLRTNKYLPTWHQFISLAKRSNAHVVGFWLIAGRSEEHTSELQSPYDLVCRLLLEKK